MSFNAGGYGEWDKIWIVHTETDGWDFKVDETDIPDGAVAREYVAVGSYFKNRVKKTSIREPLDGTST